MNPSELFRLLAGLAKNTQNFSVEGHLVNPAGERVRSIQHLIGPRSDAKHPRRAVALSTRRRIRGQRVSDCGHGARWNRNLSIDLDLAEQLSVRIKNLDAHVAAIGHIDIA